jgi:aspartate ammonia-lyase
MTARSVVLINLVCVLLIASIAAQENVRVEKDLLGQKEIPANAYYGVQTARALENFQISGVNINHCPDL